MATKRSTKKVSASAKPTKKTTRKTTAKSSPKTTVAVQKQPTEKSQAAEATKKTTQSVKVRKSYVLLIVLILLIGAGLYYFRGLFVAAVVNGQPISRLEVVRQAEKQSGKQTMDTLVRNALIEQKAKQQNITVSEKEIDDEIKKLKENLTKQGQTLDQVLAMQGMNQDDLRKLIKLDKLVSKMVGKDVTVTEKEVNEYIEKNKDALPQGADEETTKKQVQEQLKQQKTNEKVRNWLADLQKEAKIIQFVQY